MPDYVTSDPFLSQLAGGLAGGLTGMEQGRQQKFQENLQSQQAQRDAQSYALQNQLVQQQITAGQTTADQQQRTQKFLQGLSDIPKGFTNWTPQQRQTFWEERATAAQKAGADQTTIDSFHTQAQNEALSAQRFGAAAVDTAKIALDSAQTSNLRGLFDHQMDMLKNKGLTEQEVARIRGYYTNAARSGNTAWQEKKFALDAINKANIANTTARNALISNIEKTYDQYAIADPNSPQAQTPFSQWAAAQGYGYQPYQVATGMNQGGQPIMLTVNIPGQGPKQIAVPNPAAATGGKGGAAGGAAGGGGMGPMNPVVSAIGGALQRLFMGHNIGPSSAGNGAPAQGGYVVGQTYRGMTYLGGDPMRASSWKKTK